MAEVKRPNKHKQFQAERALQEDTERKQLLLRISALEETLLAVLTIAYGEPKARRLYQAAINGMTHSNRTTANILAELLQEP